MDQHIYTLSQQNLWYISYRLFSFIYTIKIFFLITLFNSVNITAQEAKLIQFTAEDGLPSSNIYQIIQDQKGFIWLATDKGISRFDGYTFENFTIQNGLPNNDIWSMVEDIDGKIWFSTFSQYAYYDNGLIHSIPLAIESNNSSSMIIGQWSSTNGKIYSLIRHNKINRFCQIDIQNNTHNIIRDSISYMSYLGNHDNKEWFVDIYDYNGKIDIFYPTENLDKKIYLPLDLNPHDNLTRKIVRCEDKVFFFSPKKIFEFNYEQIKEIPIESILDKETIIEDVFFGNNGVNKVFLLKTNKGFKLIDDQLQALHILSPSNALYKSVLEDQNGNIWLAATDGLYLLTSNARYSKTYALSADNKENNCTAIYIDNEEETVWASNQKNELWKITQDAIRSIALHQNNYPDIPIKHLSKWDDQLIAAGDFGIFLLSNKELQQSLINAKFPQMYERTTKHAQYSKTNFLPIQAKNIQEHSGDLLVSQWKGVSKLDKKNEELHTQYLHKNRTYVCAADKDNKIWMGGKNGLTYYENNKVIDIGNDFPALRYPINDIKVNDLGHLWIATDGYGILYFDHHTVHEVKESMENIPNKLYLDKEQILWTATNKGISKIIVKSQTPFAYDYQRITTAHGLASSEVNQVIVKNNSIYAATNKGLSVIEYSQDFNQTTPLLSIEKIEVNGKTIPIQEKYDLNYLEDNIKIHYVCLSYKSRKQINYAYQMSNIDTTWQTTQTLIREYPKLTAGDYLFQVKATDIDGNISQTQQITFYIHPPWWQTTWFRLLSFLLLLGLIGFIFQYRIRRIQQKEAEKTKINKKFAELELQALQSQMNPHFIFNSMNSIQNFIYTKEPKEAGKYIVKFSRLMRLFLNASNQKYSTLEQEIEILKKYIELEHLRFEDKFDYQIEIDKRLKIANIKIPALLLQPYVENAINHGLLYRQNKGNLWLRIQEIDKNHLHCEIEDNGVGRAKALELRKNSIRKHKPRGMKLVEERQRVMNYIDNKNIDIDIIDLIDESTHQALGTKVIVKLPIMEQISQEKISQ